MGAVDEGVDLYVRWIDELWNGPSELADLQRVAETIVTADFVGHWPDRDVRGPSELAGLITETKAMFSRLAFEITVQPFASGGMVAGRWVGRGTMADGSGSGFLGNDILRLHDGRLAEYWACSMPG